jgi:hypothetical protein
MALSKLTIMDTSARGEQSPIQRSPSADGGTARIDEPTEKFFPSGAIAFFVLLVILCLVIWFGIYFLMIERI